MSVKQTLGKVSVTPKGAWDSQSEYTFLDIVTNGGGAYLAKRNVPVGTSLANTNYWLHITEKGEKGDTGNTGNGIESTVLNDDYTLTITFTNGETYTTPSIRGAKGDTGETGNGIASTVLNADYTLTITFTDGTTYTTSSIRGAQGAKGDTGETGATGNGISSVTKTGTSGNVDTYTITFTNGTTTTFTVTNGNVTSVNGRTGAVTNVVDAYPITSQGITLAQIKDIVDDINENAEHVFFDVSALGAAMYLCTIYIDSEKYKIFDLVSGRFTEGTYDGTKLLTMCLVNAEPIATQSQIDHLQEEIDELGGVEKIKDWSQLGDLIMSGESTQYISPGDKTDVNWIKSVLGTTTHSHAVTCSDIWRFAFGVGEAEAKDYYFVYDGTDWTYNEEVIDLSDFALTVAGTIETGEVMTITTAVTPENFTFTAYDKFESDETSVPHNWVLEATYAPNTKAYDTYEALFVLDEGYTLPAGKYKLHQRYYGSQPFIDVYFTTAKAFTATDEILQFASTGYQNVACIPDSETKYYIASNIRPVYKNSNTYLASNIAIRYNQTGDDWVDISTVEGVRISAAHIQAALGNNCPAYCNLRQHLNDESANGTYVATHDFDRPSAYNFQKGYLYGIDPRVYNLILPTKTKFTAGYNNGDYTQGTTYENVDKVFLLSMKEMSFNIETSEGNVTDLYGEYTGNVLTNDAVAARAKYNKAGGTLNSYRWSRSCYSSTASYSWRVTSSGGYVNGKTINADFFAAAFMLGKKSENQE